jgi:amidohydrolase
MVIPFFVHKFRQELHQHPELSGAEAATAQRISQFIETHHPTELLTGLGGYGLAAVYTFSENGPTVVIRCELDALPIEESNDFAHRSVHPGASHKCGHDGHMAIVAGLVFWLKEQSFQKGKVVLLFQPAEETGQGAACVLQDQRFQQLKPDYIFALHNLPGEPIHSLIVREGVFTATVQSVAIRLKGKQAHASEPEHGRNPTLAIAELVQAFDRLNRSNPADSDFALLTPVCIDMGERAYGISAGAGEVHYTLRTWTEKDMQVLKTRLLDCITEICGKHLLGFTTDWFDYFPATVNDSECIQLIRKVAAARGLSMQTRPTPLKFGEDFGWFSREHTSALFGLGAGVGSPALHHHDYDFPEALLETGIDLFADIISELLG